MRDAEKERQLLLAQLEAGTVREVLCYDKKKETYVLITIEDPSQVIRTSDGQGYVKSKSGSIFNLRVCEKVEGRGPR